MNTTATATKTESTVYVGDIFHGSFGYDMTINCFWEVTRVSPSGKTVWVRELKSECSWEDPRSGAMRCRPVITGSDRFAGPETKYRVRVGDGDRPYIRDGYDCYATPMEPDRLLAGYLDTYLD